MKETLKTILQSVLYIATLANSAMAVLGIAPPAGDDRLYVAVSTGVLIAVFGYAAWTNFNATPEAKLSQRILDGLKAGKVSAEELAVMLNETEGQ